ncbi:aminoglycoside phosphotransferase family protein [Kitasatospora cathayae]|uniref:Aminoglycoside phosphotransferase family protein n=1 Tax=Kitasatospora cathayae TaxID=3004092 RepID=A0ABY7QDX5_9ACTN|nr:aminoglycoside phosphotransferase family protein [Kitasatospora sp. HUAS 3-15]WBP90959.1 aminoglycoside phosphotransferase family protein [Kitasatospora sp. HUAS 3-15]
MIEDDALQEWAGTRRWVEGVLAPGERITRVRALQGGWTSQMRRLDIEPSDDGDDGDGDDGRGSDDGSGGGGYTLVLRSFVKPFYRRHAPAMLEREAGVLRLLEAGAIPAPRLRAVDATGAHCDDPSLVMTHLPGSVRVHEDADVARRTTLLAGQLATLHTLEVPEQERPRPWQAWTSPERVQVPAATERAGLWKRAVELIDREAPAHHACFLHRDFHPGNVLFTGHGPQLAISGVVDWVETSWGPSDLDVAHCSTTLALLHGAPAGLALADAYEQAGGTLTADGRDHLYWRLLDALAFAPDAEKVAVPWRELGRTDLSAPVLAGRLEDYLQALFDRYA